MDRTDIVITHALRTPIGKFLGGFSEMSAVDLGVSLLGNLLAASGIERAAVDEVILGSARQAGLGPNPARQVSCGAGLPDKTLAYTVNQACASGLRSIVLAANQIKLGEAEVVVAGGMESMTRVPFLLTRFREGYGSGDAEVVDAMYKDGFLCPMAGKVMGATVEDLARAEGIPRDDQDAYAAQSQNRCEAARGKGLFRDEIAAVQAGEKVIEDDEHPRSGVSPASLGKLRPVFRHDGSVTAGNASGITDGAAMVLVMTRAKAEALGFPILASFVDHASAGVNPARMGIGPVPSIEKLLAKRGLKSANAFDLVEINEAFAAQVLACERALKLDRERLNVNGGSIALGHPIGATGARIVVTLLHELRRRGQATGLASLCVSGGFGVSAAFRNEDAA